MPSLFGLFTMELDWGMSSSETTKSVQALDVVASALEICSLQNISKTRDVEPGGDQGYPAFVET
jgi:hypothetical protein